MSIKPSEKEEQYFKEQELKQRLQQAADVAPDEAE